MDLKKIAEDYQLVYEKKKLDPVGKEDDDVDNDGDVDSSDEYLKKRRAAIGKAMGKDGDKEEDEEDKEDKKKDKKESLDLVSAYYSMYEHHKKDADGNTIPHEDEIEEEVEQLDELKDTTLKSYIDKAQPAARSLSSKRAVARKKQGIERALDSITGTKKKRPKSRYDIKNYEGQKKQYLVGKETRRGHDEYGKIPRNDAYREEVEVVNEVSKKTLGNYIKKASTDLATRSIKHGMSGGTETGGDPDSPENVEKINKRHSGIMKAADKLKKEAVEYTGPKKGDLKGYGSKAFKEYEKNMDPKKRQALKDKATKGMKFTHEGMSYGLYKGSGKPGGAMKDYLDKKAKMLTKKRNKQSDAAKNNPHVDSTQPSPSGRNKYEQVSFQQFQEKCWPGYEKKGMKTMFGKRYPNCVKKKK